MDPIVPDSGGPAAAATETGCMAAGRGWHGAPLDTARLRLRRLVPADAPRVAGLVDEWEVVRYTSNIPFPYELPMAERFIADVTAGMADGRVVAFAIEERLSGLLIGCIGASLQQGCAELGYWLGRSWWGQGYATEALDRMLRCLFENFPVARAWAAMLPENQPSRRVAEKAGLIFEGRRRFDMPARGVAAELDQLGLHRANWLVARSARRLVLVAAAALIDADGRVLLAQRPAGKSMAGLWEFPGGKIDPGETPEAALIRELREELGIDVGASCLAPLAFASHDYDSFHLLMPLFACRQWRGIPCGREGQNLSWVPASKLAGYPMPPADVPLVAILRDWL